MLLQGPLSRTVFRPRYWFWGVGILFIVVGIPYFGGHAYCDAESGQPLQYKWSANSYARADYQGDNDPFWYWLFVHRHNESNNKINQRYEANGEIHETQQAKPEWFRRFACDASIADYAIAVFTAVLAFFTIGLWRATARAANIAERALMEIERPWFAVETYHVTNYTPGDLPDAIGLLIGLHWRNVGKAPALVDECTIEFVETNRLPTRPNYPSPIRLQVQRAVRSDGGFTTNELGPSPDIGKDYVEGTRPLTRWVAFGRLTYREMSGTQHVTGYAVELLFPSGAIEVGGDAYNYFT